MTLTYNNKDYELMEAKEPNKRATFDIIVIFRVHTFIMDGFTMVEEISLEKAHALEKERPEISLYSKYEFVNYFYGANDEDEIKENAIKYIQDEEKNMEEE